MNKADVERKREREGKTSEEVTLEKIFTLSSSAFIQQLEQGKITNPNTLLAASKESFDRLQKTQTAPAQNFINSMFGSVQEAMVNITIGLPASSSSTEPKQINPPDSSQLPHKQ